MRFVLPSAPRLNGTFQGIVPVEEPTLIALLATAAALGFGHTITGPDHYVPFIAMSRVGRWSYAKTMAITVLCGVGHVLSSILLGVLGIALGLALSGLEWFEATRGGVAGWLLLGFGLAYLAWGIKRAIRNQPHTHPHAHADGVVHAHEHAHEAEHTHAHAQGDEKAGRMTPWILFTIFVFGPCEPLIPILMFPAAKLSLTGVALVAAVFAVCTIVTMTVVVTVGYHGVARLPLAPLARYSHAFAGFAIAACGAAIQFGL